MHNDPQLHDLLHAWKAPAAPGDFDQNVLRRIRNLHPAPAPRGWRAWLAAPLRLAVAAALLAIVMGAGAGLTLRRPAAPPFAFAAGHTLTGSYLHLAQGVAP